MRMRVAINGFGRIGRRFLWAALEQDSFDVVAINDPAEAATLAHLLRYDSVHGMAPHDVVVEGEALYVGGRRITLCHDPDPRRLPWRALNIDLVAECSGRMTTREHAGQHCEAGARRVAISAPGQELDGTFCYGINHQDYDPQCHRLVSNASCTTNCLAAVCRVVLDSCGLRSAMMNTVHPYTNGQPLLDSAHGDLRRSRGGAGALIPTTTGATRAVVEVLPQLKGRISGMSVRVPVADVSILDLVVEMEKPLCVQQANDAFRQAADGPLHGVLACNDLPLVSRDYLGHPASAIIDTLSTQVVGKRLLRVIAWYDNEAGYAHRLADLVGHMARREMACGRSSDSATDFRQQGVCHG